MTTDKTDARIASLEQAFLDLDDRIRAQEDRSAAGFESIAVIVARIIARKAKRGFTK